MMDENINTNNVIDIINGGSIIITWSYMDNKLKPDYAIMVKGNTTYDIKFSDDTTMYDTKEAMLRSIKNRLDLIFDFRVYTDIYELNKWSAQYGMDFSYHVEEKKEEESTVITDESKTILVYCFIESYDRYRIVNEKVHNKYPNALILNPYVMIANNGNSKIAFHIFYTIDQIKKMTSCIDMVYIDLEYLNKDHKPNWKKLKKFINACKEANIDIEYSHPLESEYRYLINKTIAIQLETEVANKIGNTEYPWYNEDITQTYLIYPNEGYTARLRHSAITENSDCGKFDSPKDNYYLTLKSGTIDDGVRVEEEQELAKEQYDLLLKWADPKANIIKKRRFNIQVPGSDLIKLISIDHYTSGQMTAWNYDVLEIEFRNPPTENIRINTIGDELSGLDSSLKLFEGDNILNITGNKAFSNKALAFNDFVNPLAKLAVKEGILNDIQ